MNLVSQDEKRRMEEAQERARKADEEKQRAAMEAQQAQQNKDLYVGPRCLLARSDLISLSPPPSLSLRSAQKNVENNKVSELN